MITLHGMLRQSGQVTIKERPMVKLWVEHESPRDNGPSDLKIEEFFLPVEQEKSLPKPGSQIGVEVRPYPSGRGIAFAAIRVLTGGDKPQVVHP